MSVHTPLHLRYEEQMKDHPYGLALYKPTSTKLLRPGSVGYWNDLGDWQPIAQLDDPESLQQKRLKAPEEELERAKYKVITDWDRKYSTLVTETNVTGQVGVEIPGAPASEALTFEYKSSGNFGAILITEKPIHREAFHHESPFKRWVKDNVDALMESKHKDEIKSHRLSIVTDVYSTKKSSLTTWTDSSRTIRVGFKVTAQNAVDAADEEVVVFASGFKFHIHELLGWTKVTTHPLESTSRLAGDAKDETIDEETRQKVITMKSPGRNDTGYEIRLDTFGKPQHEGEKEEEEESDDNL
ncbi:hypothetical protein W97_03755 [Coniosporium apollinis CBS 100218]|uniref:Uncharacterized protein n=1 Tax=Coniosporium apollinis (strain CBS 100218) TaxID=1168221 RepID=R7YRI9_CONA1|nr:uncharacterized protein W97_03755 [Coniosporium apollinis CBS 100218]EON64522.1 hypothetical protein W97_03755 [Coniosporium apollinis CBS 100218]